MAIPDEQIIKIVDKFKRVIGKGNGSLTIHYAGGQPQKVKADIDGDVITKLAV